MCQTTSLFNHFTDINTNNYFYSKLLDYMCTPDTNGLYGETNCIYISFLQLTDDSC